MWQLKYRNLSLLIFSLQNNIHARRKNQTKHLCAKYAHTALIRLYVSCVYLPGHFHHCFDEVDELGHFHFNFFFAFERFVSIFNVVFFCQTRFCPKGKYFLRLVIIINNQLMRNTFFSLSLTISLISLLSFQNSIRIYFFRR